MDKTDSLLYQGKEYPLRITKKRGCKSIIVRMGKDSTVLVSCPTYCTYSRAKDAAERCLGSLLKKVASVPSFYSDGYLYYLGEKHFVGEMGEKELSALLKKLSLPLFRERVAYYEKLMSVHPSYQVKTRVMKTRYGVNSRKTHSITLQSQLICFPVEVIDSVVVHELAHHFEFNHGEKFYKIVYRYCPDYQSLHARLRKGDYDGKNRL